MAVELDHPFTTARPIDDSFAAVTDLERVVPCVEGGTRASSDRPRLGQGRDRGEDGRDVDEVHGHRRGRREGRRGASRRAARQVEGGRRPGPRERDGHVHAHRRRRHDPHQRADHRQGRVDGRGRRGRRARRADQGLHGQARRSSDAMATRRRCARSGRARCRSTAGPRSRRTPTGPPSAATGPTTTSASQCGNVLADVDARDADDEQGARQVRALPTVNVSANDVERTPRAQEALSAQQRGAVAAVRGGAVAVQRRDPHERRMAHRRRREVDAARRGRRARAARRRSRSPSPAGRGRGGRSARTRRGRAPYSLEVEADRRAGGVELERGEAERREVRRAVDLDDRSGRLVHEVDGQQQVLARRRAAPRGRPRAARRSRASASQRRRHRRDERRVAARLGDALEPDVALLAQPVERLPGEDDPVFGRRLREGRANIARRHRTDARPGADEEQRLENGTGRPRRDRAPAGGRYERRRRTEQLRGEVVQHERGR